MAPSRCKLTYSLDFLHPVHERLQPPRPRRMPQLAQRLRLDLPDALARHLEALSDLFQRVLGAILQAEAHLDHALLARGQGAQHRQRLRYAQAAATDYNLAWQCMWIAYDTPRCR